MMRELGDDRYHDHVTDATHMSLAVSHISFRHQHRSLPGMLTVPYGLLRIRNQFWLLVARAMNSDLPHIYLTSVFSLIFLTVF